LHTALRLEEKPVSCYTVDMKTLSLSLADALQLSVSERILLAEDIWDSVASMPEAVLLSDEQRRELDARLERYHTDPTAGAPWDVVKKRLRVSA